jgi:hypothetical protein
MCRRKLMMDVAASTGRKVGRYITAHLVAAGCLGGAFVIVVMGTILPVKNEIYMIVKVSRPLPSHVILFMS